MKAAIRKTYGGPEKIKIVDIETPLLKENEVLIKNHFSNVTRTDCHNLTAKPYFMRLFLGLFKPRKIVLGTVFSGEVVECGKGVNKFKPGDRVFGFDDQGNESMAEYLSISEDSNILTIPDNISYEQAAAALEGANYAHALLDKVDLKPNSKILILGASGAIGSAGLQFYKALGHEIHISSREKDFEKLKDLGAAYCLDYEKFDYTQLIDKFNLVYDSVGKSRFANAKKVLEENGIYISSDLGPGYENIWYAINTRNSKKMKVIFPIPAPFIESMSFIKEKLIEGSFRPLIDKSYKLEDCAKAFGYVMSEKKTGNVLIDIISEK